jgi:hypothetical protein
MTAPTDETRAEVERRVTWGVEMNDDASIYLVENPEISRGFPTRVEALEYGLLCLIDRRSALRAAIRETRARIAAEKKLRARLSTLKDETNG